MERPSPPLPLPPRLLPSAIHILPTHRHAHHFPRELSIPRASDELYYEETARLRIHLYDVTTAYCGGSEIPFLQGEDNSQRESTSSLSTFCVPTGTAADIQSRMSSSGPQ